MLKKRCTNCIHSIGASSPKYIWKNSKNIYMGVYIFCGTKQDRVCVKNGDDCLDYKIEVDERDSKQKVAEYVEFCNFHNI